MNDIIILKNIYENMQNALNIRLIETSNTLLYDIYDTLSPNDKLLLNKQITPEILHCLQPAVKIDFSINFTKSNRVQLNPQKRCMARVRGAQCSRGRILTDPGGMINEFCNGHMKALPYGRIDGPLEGKALHLKKTCGRKSIIKKTPKTVNSMSGLDCRDYIRTEKINFEGIDYLIDEHGIFYSCEADNTIVGQIKDDKIYWYN